MKQKCKLLIASNILFYIFIFVHKAYSEDYLPQVLFYMWLAFSSTILEHSLRNKLSQIKLYSFSLYVIAVLFFIPLINTKAIVRKKIEEACKRYKLEIKSQQQI